MEEMFEIAGKCVPSQIAESICELAAQVDETKSKEARDLLIQTMDALLYMINPARGELIEVTPDEGTKRTTRK